jgi:hypothetical protein
MCFHQSVMTEPLPIPRWTLFFACLAVAIGMTAPVWFADKPSLIGHWSALDLPVSVWAHWWVADALARFANPFVGTASYFPVGMDPVLQYNLVDAFVGAPWVWAAGPRLGYNLAAITALTMTGLGGIYLARAAGAQRSGALLCGLTIESSSYVAMELFEGRISQILLVFWLLALGGLVRVVRGQGSSRLALATGLCAAAAAGVYWYHGFAWLLAGLVIVLGSIGSFTRQTWRELSIAAAAGLAVCLPFVFALLDVWTDLPGVHRIAEDATAGSNPVSLKTGLEIATENSRWPLWPLIGRADQQIGHQLSLVTLALGAWAVFARTPHRIRWVSVAAVGWVLAMGPYLHGWNEATDIGLPFFWIRDHLPTFDRMWWPQRFEVLTVVGTAVLAGLGLDQWIRKRGRPALWLGIAVALSLVDAPIRSGVLPIKADAVPQTSAALYADLVGPLLTVPVLPPVTVSNRALWNQTQHGQPTLNGDGEHIEAHRPQAFSSFVDNNGVLAALHRLGRQQQVSVTIMPADVDALLDAGFTYAVVDPAVFPDARGRRWTEMHVRFFRQLFGEPMRRSERGAVWKIEAIDEARPVLVQQVRGRERRQR